MHDAPPQWLCSNCETIPCPYLTSSAAARRRSLRLWVHQVSWFLFYCVTWWWMEEKKKNRRRLCWDLVSCGDGSWRRWGRFHVSLLQSQVGGAYRLSLTRGKPCCSQIVGEGLPVLRLWDDELIFLGLLGFWVDGLLSAPRPPKKRGKKGILCLKVRNFTSGLFVLVTLPYLSFKYKQVRVWQNFLYNRLQTVSTFTMSEAPCTQQLMYSSQKPIRNISVPFLLYFLSQMFNLAFLGSLASSVPLAKCSWVKTWKKKKKKRQQCYVWLINSS